MNPPPLTWTKATFHVPIRPPGESKLVPFPVAGIVSGPFGIFRGDTWTATDPYAVTGPGIETARWLLQCCQRRYEL